jgi:Icc-related predicted phosphoesterase
MYPIELRESRSMKILPISDVHLEFSALSLRNTEHADVLVICGDLLIAHDLYRMSKSPTPQSPIGKRWMRGLRYREFFSQITSEFEHVIYLPGNHEYYYGRWSAVPAWLSAECDQYPSIHFLNNDSITINDTIFIGSTLWTNMNYGDAWVINSIQHKMNDYQYIRNDTFNYRRLRTTDVISKHNECLQYYTDTLDSLRTHNNTKNIVILSHHAPSYNSISGGVLTSGDNSDMIPDMYAYASDLRGFIKEYPEITYWIHGHTHNAVAYTIGNTNILCNPRGYHEESTIEDTGWNPKLIIEL